MGLHLGSLVRLQRETDLSRGPVVPAAEVPRNGHSYPKEPQSSLLKLGAGLHGNFQHSSQAPRPGDSLWEASSGHPGSFWLCNYPINVQARAAPGPCDLTRLVCSWSTLRLFKAHLKISGRCYYTSEEEMRPGASSQPRGPLCGCLAGRVEGTRSQNTRVTGGQSARARGVRRQEARPGVCNDVT